MQRLTWIGLGLASIGAIGVLALDTIGTAHASRAGASDYFIAVGIGSPVRLLTLPTNAGQTPVAAGISSAQRPRVLVCRSALSLATINVGYRCN